MAEVINEIEVSPWELWYNAIGWALIGMAFFKGIIYDRRKKFDAGYWFRDNGLDVFVGILATLITIKLGAIVIDLLKIIGIDLSGIKEAMNNINMDPVQSALVIQIAFQYWLYKRKVKRKEDNIVLDMKKM